MKIRGVLEGLFLAVPERAELLVCLIGRSSILRADLPVQLQRCSPANC